MAFTVYYAIVFIGGLQTVETSSLLVETIFACMEVAEQGMVIWVKTSRSRLFDSLH